MTDISSVLNDKEKRLLSLLGLLLLLSVIFFAFFSLGQRRIYHRLSTRLESRGKALAAVEKKRAAAVEEWARWEEAYRDMEGLRKGYFYQEKEGINTLRLNLQRLFAEAGINARSQKYSYVDLPKEKIKTIEVTFNFTGSYIILKRFLENVERFPKFLVLDKIDFQKISSDGNLLELKIVLAAYYETD